MFDFIKKYICYVIFEKNKVNVLPWRALWPTLPYNIILKLNAAICKILHVPSYVHAIFIVFISRWCQWKRFPHFWPFVRGFTGHRGISPTKGPVMRGFDYFFLLLARTSCWANTRVTCDLRRRNSHVTSLYDYYIPQCACNSAPCSFTIFHRV